MVCMEQTELQCLSLSEHECPVRMDRSQNSSYISVSNYSMRVTQSAQKNALFQSKTQENTTSYQKKSVYYQLYSAQAKNQYKLKQKKEWLKIAVFPSETKQAPSAVRLCRGHSSSILSVHYSVESSKPYQKQPTYLP